MAAYSGNFGELLELGLRIVYGDTYKQYPEEYSKVFEVDTSTKPFEEDLRLAGLGEVPEKPEGQSVTYDMIDQGETHRYTHATFGLGFAVPRELLEDDQYRKIKQMPKALARSVRHSVEQLAADVLNSGFSGSSGIDGKGLFDTAHPTVSGGTYQNKPTTASDLTVTSLEQAFIDIATYIDERGLKIMAIPKLLVVHPADRFNAEVVLKPSQIPGTANNDVNPMYQALGFTTMHWLTDPDAWFVVTDVPNGLTFFWRRRPEFTRDNDFDSEIAKFKTTYRCSVGWTDPRGVYGNPGA